MLKLAIYGAGGMGRETMIAARETGHWEDIFFIVDEEYMPENREIKGCSTFALEEIRQRYRPDEIEMLVCVGEPTSRVRLKDRIEKSGFKLGRFIDPSVKIHSCTKLGRGVIILRGCILASDVTIGDNSALSFGVILGHDNTVGENCYFAPGVCTGGLVHWGDCSFAGLGCTVREGAAVGEHSIIGQGAVVVKGVQPHTTVVGNPAKPLQRLNFGKVFK